MLSKVKLLAVTDDIRLPTGVGIQANKLLLGLQKTGLFEISQIGGSLIPQPPQPVELEGVRIYPVSDGYGNAQQLRVVMSKERPDIVLAFSDPRFFIYLFTMDNEIRHHSKFIFYHTWDEGPFPKFNLPWYSACDKIVTLSNFAHNLLKEGGVDNVCIPHGYDPQEFYRLKGDKIQSLKEELALQTHRPDVDFIIFWNNRNIHRKRMNDVIKIFEIFYRKHPHSLLLMNTNPVDNEGNDLLHFLKDLNSPDLPLVLNFSKVTSDKLNEFYNMADVSINIAYNEGFGLSIGESLLSETPVIASDTGGITEQMSDGKSVFGRLLKPAAKELFGVPGMPYIYRDFVSYEDTLSALENIYSSKEYFRNKGVQGREHIINNFHTKDTVEKWKNLLLEVKDMPSQYKRFELTQI